MITCPAFTNQFSTLAAARKKIRRSVRPIEKDIFAEDIDEAITNLLECAAYDRLNTQCRYCRRFARYQMKAAGLHAEVDVQA